tara:strand:- start:47 stop:871 length:825 start_codon:yes stop_codon:yes gene_type:complete
VNIEEYISSGILEAYALNELSAKEMREVEAVMARYPEVKAELNAIEKAFEDMAMATQVAPKPEMKKAILDKIDEQTAPSAEQPTTRQDTPKVVSLPASQGWKYAVAASLVLALVSGYLAIDYRSKWKSSSQAYAQLLASNSQMAEQYNQVNQKLDQLETDFGILSNPNFRRIGMAGTDNAKEAYADVYWNETTEELYLNIVNLQELAADKQYQLWAIVDGQPVDAGVFDWNAEGLVKMKRIAQSAAFAVTVEPKGGSESPSLETMQVLGNVKKS